MTERLRIATSKRLRLKNHMYERKGGDCIDMSETAKLNMKSTTSSSSLNIYVGILPANCQAFQFRRTNSPPKAGRSSGTLHASLKHLEVGSCASEKKCYIPDSLRILALFQIRDSQLLSAPNWNAKCLDFFQPVVGWCPDDKGWFSLYARLDHLEVEYCQYERSARILRFPGF
jgi:hypothetical protein